jgi:hypothetical protein
MVWFQAEKTRANPLVLSGKLSTDRGSRQQIAQMADLLAWPSDFSAWQTFLQWLFTAS